MSHLASASPNGQHQLFFTLSNSLWFLTHNLSNVKVRVPHGSAVYPPLLISGCRHLLPHLLPGSSHE
jgi:hypothetical protein